MIRPAAPHSPSDSAVRESAPPEIGPELVAPEEVGVPDAVAVPEAQDRPWHTRIADAIAFFLSAFLSPYLVIPAGTVGIVYARAPANDFPFWIGISLLFSIVFPVTYILLGMWRGVITDVHVMEREQRSGPFLVAIFGSLIGAVLLYYLGAPRSVWGLNLLLSFNGVVILFITRYTKISVHISVLAVTVFGGAVLHPEMPRYAIVALLCLVPLLIWARVRRQRHTIWQSLGGVGIAILMTIAIVAAIGLSNRLAWFIQRATSS